MTETSEGTTLPGFRMHVPLLQLHASLTDGCSLICQNCAHPARAHQSGNHSRYLILDTLIRAVDEARQLGLRSLRLSGAQPLLYPNLAALLEFLSHEDLSVVLEIHGPGMTPTLAHRLVRLPSLSVLIGLDGADAGTHDQINGAHGLFAQAISSARMLSKVGLVPDIICNLKRQNASQMESIVRVAENLRAGSVHFILPQPALEMGGTQAQEPFQVAELIALGRRVERVLETRTRLRLLFGAPPAFRGLHPMARIEGQGRCSALNMLAILPGGEYALCGMGQRIPELVLGLAGHDALDRIWKDHPLLQKLRDGMPDQMEGVCGHCIMKSACQGNCTIENFVRNGSFWGPYWFCEAAYQAGLFPAGRLIENIW